MAAIAIGVLTFLLERNTSETSKRHEIVANMDNLSSYGSYANRDYVIRNCMIFTVPILFLSTIIALIETNSYYSYVPFLFSLDLGLFISLITTFLLNYINNVRGKQ